MEKIIIIKEKDYQKFKKENNVNSDFLSINQLKKLYNFNAIFNATSKKSYEI